MEQSKTCTKCGETKPITKFYKHRRYRDGLRSECKNCTSNVNRVWRESNKDVKRAINKNWYEGNKERRAATEKAWREANKERRAAVKKAWREKNPKKTRLYYKLWNRRVRRATPKWLTEEHKQKILATYNQARDCTMTTGELYHTDHIVPLKGENVCGLHVPWNLQVLPQDVNDSKGNKFDGGWDAYVRG